MQGTLDKAFAVCYNTTMNSSLFLSLLSDILTQRKTSACALAEKYGVSERTVYRYVKQLASVLPLSVKKGRNGGIVLSDAYRLPVGFFSEEEFQTLETALKIAYAVTPDPRFLNVKRKIAMEEKAHARANVFSGDLEELAVVDEALCAHSALAEKLRVFQECISKRYVTEILYLPRGGKEVLLKIEPHVLVLSQGVWRAYAFCHSLREFRLYSLGKIRFAKKTEDRFQRRQFDRADILPPTNGAPALPVRLALDPASLDKAKELFGAESVREREGVPIAEFSLPSDERLPVQLAALEGLGRIEAPSAAREQLLSFAKNILEKYGK